MHKNTKTLDPPAMNWELQVNSLEVPQEFGPKLLDGIHQAHGLTEQEGHHIVLIVPDCSVTGKFCLLYYA